MLKVKLLHTDAKVPSRANPTDAGLDLYSVEEVTLGASCFYTIDTGISMAVPDGYVGRILPRSGLAVKGGIDVLAGVVDSSYRGSVKVVLVNHGFRPCRIKPGDRMAQLVIQKIELWTPNVVEELDSTARGEKGFGSSGIC